MEHTESAKQSSQQAPQWPGHWFWGHLLDARRDMLGLIMRGRDVAGDILRVPVISTELFFLYDPEAIHRVLVSHAANYTKSTRGYEKLRLMLGQGLVTSEGDFWRRQRRIAQPAFHHQKLAGFANQMSQAAEDWALRWDQKIQQNEVINVAQEMMRLTLRIAGETLFSTDISQNTDQFGKYLTIALEHFNHIVSHPIPKFEYLPLPSNLRFWSALHKLRRMTWALIKERRESGEDKGDLLSMLMLTRDEETGEHMDDQQLLDEVFTMLAAGHETTANALAWTLYLLSQHPDIADRVAQEAERVLGDRSPTMADFKELGYTKQVFQEAIRLFPPIAALGRTAKQADTLGGYHIPAGSHVYVMIYALHRHPTFWDNPDFFDPERFSPAGLEQQKSQGHGRPIYMPFSQGQRKCIGDHFAMLEGVLILAVLARRFKFALVPGTPVEPELTLTLRPKYGLPMRLQQR